MMSWLLSQRPQAHHAVGRKEREGDGGGTWGGGGGKGEGSHGDHHDVSAAGPGVRVLAFGRF